MVGTTGYGYDDMGRDALDRVFAQAMGAEDALVRHTFVSGTHALTVALFGVLRTGDTMVAVTAVPTTRWKKSLAYAGRETAPSRIMASSINRWICWSPVNRIFPLSKRR